jgi:CheY-like chemotaxis protein
LYHPDANSSSFRHDLASSSSSSTLRSSTDSIVPLSEARFFGSMSGGVGGGGSFAGEIAEQKPSAMIAAASASASTSASARAATGGSGSFGSSVSGSGSPHLKGPGPGPGHGFGAHHYHSSSSSGVGGGGQPVEGDSGKSGVFPKLTRSLHVLLVDDMESILKITRQLLHRNGHSSDMAINGVVALEKIEESMLPGARPYDVIVMDLQMPVLDGLETTSRLRGLEQVAQAALGGADADAADTAGGGGSNGAVRVPYARSQLVIGLSANGDEDTERAAYEAGVNHFIEKPFSMDKLLDALEDLQFSIIED